MSTFGRLYRGETHIDFVGNRRRGFTFSGVMVAIALLSMIFSGFRSLCTEPLSCAKAMASQTSSKICRFSASAFS